MSIRHAIAEPHRAIADAPAFGGFARDGDQQGGWLFQASLPK